MWDESSGKYVEKLVEFNCPFSEEIERDFYYDEREMMSDKDPLKTYWDGKLAHRSV